MKIDTFYHRVIADQIANEPLELNQRTGIKTSSLPGITFQTDLQKDGFPLLSLRKMPFSFIPEIMWFLSGQKNSNWLSKHTKIWDSFREKNGDITSAYGYRWRYHFEVDQIREVLEKLRDNPSDRQAVVIMWSPYEDLRIKQKNVPCPFSFTLNIIKKRLHLHLIIRSNDMILGFPTDVAGFAFLTHIFAQKLEVDPGILTVSISNAHVYENQLDALEIMYSRKANEKPIEFDPPKDLYQRACNLDEQLINEVTMRFKDVYKPHSVIKSIPIAI